MSASALASSDASTSAPDLHGGDWWREAGDTTLAELIVQGLANNRTLDCQALALDKANRRARSHERQLTTRIERLFDTRGLDAGTASRSAQAYRYAAARARIANEIALAYIETRRLQEILVERTKVLDAYDDNAQIAGFREEAGLVSGVDTGLARTVVATSGDGIESARDKYTAQRDALARLVGLSSDGVQDMLGEAGSVPDFGVIPPAETTAAQDVNHRADLLALERRLIAHLIEHKVSQAQLDTALSQSDASGEDLADQAVAQWRKARSDALDELSQLRSTLASTDQRQAALESAMREASATRDAARLAYRMGTGDFATLLVAEKASLGVIEARINARAARARTAIRIRQAEGQGWSQADLAPPAPPANGPEVLVCE